MVVHKSCYLGTKKQTNTKTTKKLNYKIKCHTDLNENSRFLHSTIKFYCSCLVKLLGNMPLAPDSSIKPIDQPSSYKEKKQSTFFFEELERLGTNKKFYL